VEQDIWPISSTQTFITAFESNGIQQSDCNPSALTADFVADNLTPGIGETVNFTDLSTNSPYAWSWTFTPSTVTYVGGTSSSSQNPQVQFNADGYYTVELTATNTEGSDTEEKSNYILVYGATVADFSADILTPNAGQTVTFTDLSTYDPFSWSWDITPATFTYVGGTSSSSQNPQVQFNEIGHYTIELTATNIYGSDAELKPNYINIPLYCAASGGSNYLYISSVEIGDINNQSDQDFYRDYTYLSTDLTQGETGVEITVVNGNNFGNDDLGVWVDWDQDGSFNEVDDNIVCEINDEGQGTFFFDVPSDAVPGTTTMRVRIKYNLSDCGDPCGTTTYGEVEDYSINIIASIDPPVADFEADNTTPGVNETVSFTDLSTNNPDTWSWSFDPSTVTYVGGTNSGSQNPQVEFNAPGYYTVELVATNAGGSDTETKYDYINVSDPEIDIDVTVFLEGPYSSPVMNTDLNSDLPLTQPFNTSPWNYPGTENVVSIPGTDIVDWLLVDIRDALSVDLATPATSIGMQAAFLRNDGRIVDLDGNPSLNFMTTLSNDLYVVIFHRNHISVITANAPIPSEGVYNYNFSTASGQAYGGPDGHKELETGIWGMMSGDGDGSGLIDIDDKTNIWDVEAGTKGYKTGDYNLDMDIDNKDKNDNWQPNEDKGTYVPD